MDAFIIVILVAVLAVAALQVVLLARAGRSGGYDRLERELRESIAAGRRDSLDAARVQREELTATISHLSQTITAQMTNIATVQSNQLNALTESNARRLAEVRETLETKLKQLSTDNAQKLEQMRQTVDEKLHATLETRLAESFKLVSERLEQVHKGLGEMQTLAAGVGDLKRVLSNVKTRGTWGEIQLGSLLEQMLAPEQYDRNVEIRRGTGERVEFAIRFPGRDENGAMWLPIDAKFPREDYERLLDAQDRADAQAADESARKLEAQIKAEARTIRDKYLDPPRTTDFALLFLPIEGLYAEVLRRPGLVETLQRECRVTVAGPTTLTALLNSLQMGFRTLAIEKRSSEVWTLLGAVKTEFGKFATVLEKTKRKLEEASNTIGDAEIRTRQIERKLRGVEALPAPQAAGLLEDVIESEVGMEPQSDRSRE